MKRLVAVICGVAILLLLMRLTVSFASSESIVSSSSRTSIRPLRNVPAPTDSKTTRSDSPLATHRMEHLPNFFLEPIHLENVTLSQTLDHLFLQYKAICEETEESPLNLNYEILGKPKMIESFSVEGGNFLFLCTFAGAIAGLEMAVNDNGLTFSTPAIDTPEKTVSVNVQPITLSAFLSFLEQPGDEKIVNGSTVNPSDSYLLTRVNIADIDTPIVSSPEGIQLSGDARQISLLKALLEAFAQNTSGIIMLEVSRFDLTTETPTALPTVMARANQETRIELGTTRETMIASEAVTEFLGTSIIVNPRHYGFAERVSIDAVVTPQLNKQDLQRFEEGRSIDAEFLGIVATAGKVDLITDSYMQANTNLGDGGAQTLRIEAFRVNKEGLRVDPKTNDLPE